MNDNLNTSDIELPSDHLNLVKVIKQVTSGKPITIHQNGEQVAALISIEDLRLLEHLIEKEEDRIDIADAKQILAEVKKQGTVPWEDIKVKLGL